MSILLNLLFFVATIPVRIGRSRARIRDHNSFWWKKKERERERERRERGFCCRSREETATASSSRLWVRAPSARSSSGAGKEGKKEGGLGARPKCIFCMVSGREIGDICMYVMLQTFRFWPRIPVPKFRLFWSLSKGGNCWQEAEKNREEHKR